MHKNASEPCTHLLALAELLMYSVRLFTALKIFSMTSKVPRVTAAPMLAFEVLCQNLIDIFRIEIVINCCDSIVVRLH